MSSMRLSLLAACVVLGINAEGAPHRSKRPDYDLASFIVRLSGDGDDDFIRPNIAPLLALMPNTKTKSYDVDRLPKLESGEPEKTFDLAMSSTARPDCGVIMDALTTPTESNVFFFKMDLDGTLRSAIRTKGRRKSGKPVRGSGIKEDLDIHSPDVQARFKKELDFWLSGAYRKYMKPKAAGDLHRSK
jgi:hypothetical protein